MDNGRLEVLNTGNSVFIGEGAGANDNLTNNRNIFIGKEAGNSNTTGDRNTANGFRSLYSNTTGTNNTANGYHSLRSNTISNITQGYSFPKPELLIRIAEVLDVDVRELLVSTKSRC